MPTVTRFENAPLLEVIAELRWRTAQDALTQQLAPGLQIQFPDAVNASSEESFRRFAERMDDCGFRSSERIIPYGAFAPPGVAVERFRRRAGSAPLLQIGAGVFTANGLPPTYTHWGDFRPVLRMGVQALLDTRADAEKRIPFELTVRYLDGFTPDYWEGSDPGRFIDGVLGFGSSLPDSLRQHLHATRPKSASHQLNLPLRDDSSLIINVGEGNVASKGEVVLLDVSAKTANVVADLDAVMESFERNHRIIREMFFAVTEPVATLMRPTEIEEARVGD